MLADSLKPENFQLTVEIPCGDCGGRGYDLGSLFEPEECHTCHGAKTVPVERNYLKEAFRIANGQSVQPPEREHLLSLIKYARSLLSAAMALPEVA